MIIVANFAALLLSLGATPEERAKHPVSIKAIVPKGPFYVGQEITLRLEMPFHDEPRTAIIPKVKDADVTFFPGDLSASKPEDNRSSTPPGVTPNAALRVMPRQSGTLQIPPIMIHAGDRRGVIRAFRLNIVEPPIHGRPLEFLGGVGPFSVTSSVIPDQIRLGQSFEFRIHVKGPASRGMVRQPVLKRLKDPSFGMRVEGLPAEATDEPPSRTFRYRIRAERVGEFKLPPVTIASFDPQTRQFITKASKGVPLLVRDVPRLNPNTLDYRDIEASGRPQWVWILTLALPPVLITLWLLSPRIRRRWASYHHNQSLRRWIRALQRELEGINDGAQAAHLISEGLVDYLNRTMGRPKGALTPDEACEGMVEVGHDLRLSDRAAELITDCDRALFAEENREINGLVEDARMFFEELRRSEPVTSRDESQPQKPREADGTPAH